MEKLIPFFFLLLGACMNLHAQPQILEGESQLENKRIELKNNYLKIIPFINYSSKNPYQLTISFTLELYDDNNEIIKNTGDWLYLISDWNQMLDYFHAQDSMVDRSTKMDDFIKNAKPIEAFQNENKVYVKKFNFGFNSFLEQSKIIKIGIENIPNSVITLKFNFVHITTINKKIKIKERPQLREWKFRLPDTSDETVVDCKQLEAQYSKKVNEIIKEKDASYFRRQIHLQGADIERLNKDFNIFRNDLYKAGEFKKVIGNTPALNKCPELKSQLLLQIDQFLQQKDDLIELEELIASQEKDFCKKYEAKYAAAIKKIKPDKNLEYFSSQIKDPKTDVLKLEEEIQLFKKENRDLQNLYDKISKDPNSIKCNKIKKQLLQRIRNIQTRENDFPPHITHWVEIEKEELLKNKELSIERYNTKYKTDLTQLESNFRKFLVKYQPCKFGLIEGLKENNSRISYVNKIKSKSTSDLDTLTRAKELLYICTQENKNNLEIIDSISQFLTELDADVELVAKECESKFIHIDRLQGLQKAKPILTTFHKLLSEIDLEKSGIENLRNKTIANNKRISDLNDIFNPNKLIGKQKLINQYKPLFARNYSRLKELAEEFNNLDMDFENKQYRKSYYKWVKNSFNERIKKVENKINSLSEEQDTLVVLKNIDFEKNDVNIYLEDINNFKQVEANLRLRIEHLISEIDKSLHRKFPYSYLIIGLLIIAILAFGANVYINVLRNRKREQARMNNKATSPNSKITLEESYENNLDKGKGLADVRRKIGSEYMEIDLNYEWDDSAVLKLFFKRECIIKIYRFFEDSVKSTDTNSTAYETGGYLIGRWDYNLEEKNKYDVSLEEFIEPGEDAKFSNYQLNYGVKIGLKLQKVLANMKQKTGKDFIMTAWFHSHPGLKIFLSDFDLSVQEGFSREKESLKMVAMVLDPYTKNWDTGIFTYKANGIGMNNSQDSKRFFSLDRMYKWALHPQIEKPENYFTMNLREYYNDSVCEQVYFENSIILEMKRLFEDNNEVVKANTIKYIKGTQIEKGYSNSDIILEKLVGKSEFEKSQLENNNGVVGLLICSNGKAVDNYKLITKLNQQNEQILVALVFDKAEKSMTLVSRNMNLIFNKPVVKATVLFDIMIEWTRKRK